jgi:hypothetical protein
VSERGKHRNLCDVTETDDRIPDATATGALGHDWLIG